MPITNAIRQTLATASLTPDLVDIGNYAGSLSSNDVMYSPYTYNVNSTNCVGRFYREFSDLDAQRGTYAPTASAPAGTHNYFVFKLTTSSPLNAFVLNLANSVNIDEVYVKWASITGWYSAKVMYNATPTPGCAASTYSSGTRFPITLPSGETLSSATDVYVLVRLSANGYVQMDLTGTNGVRVSDT